MSKKRKLTIAILAITCIAYNSILFVLFKSNGHTATFWLSWVFMIVSFVAMTSACLILGQKGMFLRDWLFGYPIVKHSAVYVIAEFCASSLFIALEKLIIWGWAFVVQFLILCLYCICAISCFISKETIESMHNNVKHKTCFSKLLRVDAEMLIEKCDDEVTKNEFIKLAEAIRYSDPMSDESLFELEENIAKTISECVSAICSANYELAKELCTTAILQLTERNKKCEMLK